MSTRPVTMSMEDELERLRRERDAYKAELDRMRSAHPENACADMYPKLRQERDRARISYLDARKERARLLNLLAMVNDAGRPHSHLCECDACLAWLAVGKELAS